MNITELIKKLEAIRNEHGDLEVYAERSWSGFIPLHDQYPTVKHRKILKGRESKPVSWQSWDGEDRKGEKVVSF